ncbi:MAG: hypothetical protein A2V77_18265 [Anaeromyxobacter sp. RBG_16_69_14]|nr:MAG: hypothetical protein A2V77_18265 [Anaeromyxobacter sp. RBG_16_69_14]
MAGTPERVASPGEGQLADELKKMEWEPLLPVEKKLIGWSIGLGISLLGILLWVSYTFFPAGHLG